MCLKVILRLARHLYLEKEIITANNEMLKANKISKKLLVESMEHDIVVILIFSLLRFNMLYFFNRILEI